MSNGTKFKDIIVVVHGIGEQKRFSTVRSVATRLAASRVLLGKGRGHPVAPQPLGYFHSDVRNITSVRLLDDVETLQDMELASIGFAEVFWADIPQDVDKEGRTLEETKAWARTVVARAKALCQQAQEHRPSDIVPPDFGLAGEVLDEIIETIYVLENLLFLAEKAGFFKFDLRRVLEEYLGDVQLVTEFNYYRTDVVGRFHRALENIYEQQCEQKNPDVNIHIVAHSEGTVVSLLGLLHAMSKQRIVPADAEKKLDAKIEDAPIPGWLKRIRGYMTIGSPIDKHILLWPRLWKKLNPQLANGLFRQERIRWRNYYDYGDPVGFKLDSARLWLHHVQCEAFEFCGCPKCHHDIGFARYLFPGEAHNEYWNDSGVFEHFINDVVKPNPESPRPKPPTDHWLISWVSPLLPYALSFIVLLLGVFVLYKAVHAYTHPDLEPLQKFVRFDELGVRPPADLSGADLLGIIFGTAALVAGATLLARFRRLAVGTTWTLAGIFSFLMGCGLYVILVPTGSREEFGGHFVLFGVLGPTLLVLSVAAIAGLSGFLAMRRRSGNGDRRQRWFWRGMRPLIACGALAVAFIIVLQLLPRNPRSMKLTAVDVESLTTNQLRVIQESRLTPGELDQVSQAKGTNWIETLEKVNPVLAARPPVWPVVVSGAAFLYFWWLATLIFDLAFVWHRYIRYSITNKRLLEWNPYGFDLKPAGAGSCRSRPKTEAAGSLAPTETH